MEAMTAYFEGRWQELSQEVITGMAEWRLQHPKASLKEIEGALDERLNRMRARMVEDMAQGSQAADWREASEAEEAKCPECSHRLSLRGEQKRRLQTQGGEEIVLKRQYGHCPECGTGLFPPG